MRAPAALAFLALALAVLPCSCGDPGPAEIWTDVPELALAAELFNASQGGRVVALLWKESLAESLRQAKRPPSLAVGRYLKGQALRERFLPLDSLFHELPAERGSFYPGLLELGNVGGRQLLLPISFNLPLLAFPRGHDVPGDGFTLSLDEMAAASAAFNARADGAEARMGFSPRWDGVFLVLAVDGAGALFRDGDPLGWDEAGLAAGLEAVRKWSADVNGGAAREDDFQFKHLYAPVCQYVSAGRALFGYADSADFFPVPEEKRASLDYRWFASRRGSVPISDDVVYAGMPRSGAGGAAAEAFLKWLFLEDSQRAILELSRSTRAMESSFGVLGGFSSLRTVNERIMPQYYPALVGHLPPAASLTPPRILPIDWPGLKAEAIEPWLLEATARQVPPADPSRELAARVAEYREKAALR